MFKHLSKTNRISLVGVLIVLAGLIIYLAVQGGFKADGTVYNTGKLVVKLAGGTFDTAGSAVIGEVSIKDKTGKEYAPVGTKLTESSPSFTIENLPTSNPTYYTVALNKINANYVVDNSPRKNQYVFSDHGETTNFSARKKCASGTCGVLTVTVEDKTNDLIKDDVDTLTISSRDTNSTKALGSINFGKGSHLVTPKRYQYTFRELPVGDWRVSIGGGSFTYDYEMNPTVANNTGEYKGWSRNFTSVANTTTSVRFSVAQLMDANNPANLTALVKGDIDAAGGGIIGNLVIVKPTGERIVTVIKESGDAAALKVLKSLPSSSSGVPRITGYQVALEKLNPKYAIANIPGNTNPRLNVKVTTGKSNTVGVTLYRNIASNCTSNCGTIKVTGKGTDSGKTRDVAQVAIIAPDGKQINLGTLTEGATEPSLTSGQLQPGNNYQVLLTNINSELQLNPTITGNVVRRTGLTVTANQPLDIMATFMTKNDGLCDRSVEPCGAVQIKALGVDDFPNRSLADFYAVAPTGRKIPIGGRATGDHSISQYSNLKPGPGWQVLAVGADYGPGYPCFEVDPKVANNANPRKWFTLDPWPGSTVPLVEFTFRQKATCTGSIQYSPDQQAEQLSPSTE